MAMSSRNLFSNSEKPRHEISDTDRENVREVFGIFDSDKDNRIDFHELKCAMKALGFEPTKQQVNEIIKKTDPVSQRYVSFKEFETEMYRRLAERDPEYEIRRAFEVFKGDNSTSRGITVGDLKRVAQLIGENIPDDELAAMIDEFDLDDDGEISLDEFMRICMK